MSDELTFTKLSESDNCASWPEGETTITWAVEGPLAVRIRRAAGVIEGTPVVIEEVQTDGGWSEYTQETYYNFTLRVGRHVVDLDEGGHGVDYFDDLPKTTIGRLDDWLRKHEEAPHV